MNIISNNCEFCNTKNYYPETYTKNCSYDGFVCYSCDKDNYTRKIRYGTTLFSSYLIFGYKSIESIESEKQKGLSGEL